MNLQLSTRIFAHRTMRMASVLGLSLVLTACGSVLSGAGPYSSSITSKAGDKESNLPYKLIDISPETVHEYARKPAPPLSARVSTTDATTIRLVGGDVIKVTISDSAEGGVFAPLAAGGTVFGHVRVSSAGTITLPYVGSLKVSGYTLPQVDSAIRRKLAGSVATDPQVYSELVGDLSGSVLVAGAVKTPGRFSSLSGPLTILDVVNMAGGPVLEPHLINVTVRTGKQVYTINYDEVLSGGNRQLAPRSEVILERARQRFVAMGAVREPGDRKSVV